MHEDRLAFNRGAVRPLECLREGWRLIQDKYWLFVGISFVAMLITSIVPFYIMLGPMMCGVHICLFHEQQGRRVSFEMLFDGFNYFAQSLIATMIFFVPMVILLVVWYGLFFAALVGVIITLAPNAQGQQPDAGLVLATIFGIEGIFILGALGIETLFLLLAFFIYPLVVDRELTGTQAALLSMKAVWGNLWGVVAVVLLDYVFLTVGLMFCFVGMIFVIPIGFAMTAIAYRQVFPAEDHMQWLRPDPEPWDDDDDADDTRSETGIQTEPRPRRASDGRVRKA